MIVERLKAEWWAVGIALSLAIVGIVYFNGLSRVDNLIYDDFQSFDLSPGRSDVVIVTVDDASIGQFGPWPWPRALQARLVERVARAKPRAAALDLILIDKGETGGDEALANAMRSSGVPFFLPAAITQKNDALSVEMPRAGLQKVSAGVGHADFVVDEDGLVRRAYLDLPASGRLWPHLMKLVAAESANRKGFSWQTKGTATVPVLIPFAAAHKFPKISAEQLLGGNVPDSAIAGKFILIGVTSHGVETQYSTPIAGNVGFLSSVEIQGYFLSALLDDNLRYTISKIWLSIISVLPIWLMLSVFRKLKPINYAMGVLIIILSFVGLSVVILLRLGIWVPPGAGLMGLAFTYPLWSWRRLIAVMDFMNAELIGFTADPALIAVAPSHASATLTSSALDPVSNKARLLSATIHEAQILRRFVTETVRQFPTAMMVVDRDGGITLSNDAADAMFLRSGAGTILGSSFTELVSGFAPVEPNSLSLDKLLIDDGDHRRKIEVMSPDGMYYDLNTGPFLDASGNIGSWIVQFSDVTPTKLAYKEREELMQLLSHDMRSPLVSILTLLQFGEDKSTSSDLDAIRRYVSKVLVLADDFILLARAQAVTYAAEPVSLRSLVEDAADELWPQYEAAGVVLEIIGVEEPWLVAGDAFLLARTFVNLFGNAIKYAANGKRVLCTVENIAGNGTQEVCVTVRDWGPGIPPADIGCIFDRFSQVSPRNHRGGVGLGLSFVNIVVQRHQGTVVCESEPGHGTRFILTFPALLAH